MSSTPPIYLVILIDKTEVRLVKGKSVKAILDKDNWTYVNIDLYKSFDEIDKALEFMRHLI